MQTTCFLIYLSSFYPLLAAWRANRKGTLSLALGWAIAAWACWGWVILSDSAWQSPLAHNVRYAALCLTGCAGVAVLGARRPIVRVWNFVVAALLLVLFLPVAESTVVGRSLFLSAVQALFVGAVLAVAVVNYVPTRLGPAAALLAVTCTIDLLVLAGPAGLVESIRPATPFARWLLVMIPWVAYGRIALRPRIATELDRTWLDFRDRHGLVWAQRVREQFNNAARNAGWRAVLRWRGLWFYDGASVREPEQLEEMENVLRSLLKRFGPEEM